MLYGTYGEISEPKALDKDNTLKPDDEKTLFIPKKKYFIFGISMPTDVLKIITKKGIYFYAADLNYAEELAKIVKMFNI